MDFDSIKNQVSNLTLYDLKAGFRKAQNAVMNYTEMEAKVREATNNEPWGASTSMMQEIANATFNYASLNEVMPMIYKRFTEKSAEEWRQIYKALQLLEFLIKNGSERVIDDARSHVSLLKMLRQFHYIDLNGKDQGINVRNRAKELAELLSDVERIRTERKKARTNRNKYGGVEGGPGAGSGASGASSRYGGFGNESATGASTFGGFSGGVYGDGGGFGGASGDDYNETQSRRDRFEEYDEYDEGAVASPASRTASKATPVTSKAAAPKISAAKPKPKAPEVDLFDFNDETTSAPQVSNGNKAAIATSNDFGIMQSAAADDDDFDDFQSAVPVTSSTTLAAPPRQSTVTSTSQFTSPAPIAPQTQPSFANNLYSSISPPPTSTTASNYSAFSSLSPTASVSQQSTASVPTFQQSQQPRPSGYQSAQPNYFGSISATTATPSTPTGGQQQRSDVTSPLGGAKGTSKTASGVDPFASLSLGGMGGKKAAGMQAKGPSMADLNKEKATAGIWGASPSPVGGPRLTQPQSQSQSQGQNQGGSAGDLLGL